MILLASASPRRQELLRAAGVRFRTWPVPVDENELPGENAETYTLRVATEKARATRGAVLGRACGTATFREDGYAEMPDLPILAADTTVELDGTLLHKPGDVATAMVTLRRLSGREHRVRTAVVLLRAGEVASVLVTTSVHFRPYDDSTIEAYVATGEPLDRAGGYAIQGQGMVLVDRIVGSYTNVVGLPVRETLELIG